MFWTQFILRVIILIGIIHVQNTNNKLEETTVKTCLKRKQPFIPLETLISIVRLEPPIETLENPISVCDAVSEICTIFLKDDNPGIRASAERNLVEVLSSEQPSKIKFLALRALTSKNEDFLSFESLFMIEKFKADPNNAAIVRDVERWNS
jgi:hypothetical protein